MRFLMFDLDTDRPQVYYLDSSVLRGDTHLHYLRALELESIDEDEVFTGNITYDPDLTAPDGSPRNCHYEIRRGKWFLSPEAMLRFHTALAASMSVPGSNLALFLTNGELPHLQPELSVLREYGVPLFLQEDYDAEIDFLALNTGEGYGRLRLMASDERPHSRDIVVYDTLPNELPRVAGIASTVPQTQLSHINLRAVQDGVPNAYIRNATNRDGVR